MRFPDLPNTRRAGKSNLMAEIMAAINPSTWWRPAQDQEPDPGTDRVTDGTRDYERVPAGWQATDGDRPVYTWDQIPAPLVASSTGEQTAPPADWHACSPDEVYKMVERLIDVMSDRRKANPDGFAVTGDMWTTTGGAPVFLITFAEEEGNDRAPGHRPPQRVTPR